MSKVHEIVTGKILEALERGVIPWQRPWSLAGGHRNIEGRPYTGVNPILLEIAAEEAGYEQPAWATYKQAQKHGGQVRKDEKGSLITFYKVWNKINEETGEEEQRFTLRYYKVWNVAQIDGLDWQPAEPVAPGADPLAAGEEIIDGMPNAPKITVKQSDRAFYRPSTDSVTLPALSQYEEPEAFYRTAFHELVHSTGHKSRLDRNLTGRFGTPDYAREELIAEIGAAILCATSGISHEVEDSAAYIATWQKALSDDPRLIVTAASKAQKAADYITGKGDDE